MNRLRGYRVMAGYTQDDLANFLGIDRTTYQKKENQERKFSNTEKEKILEKLKEKIPELTEDGIFPSIH